MQQSLVTIIGTLLLYFTSSLGGGGEQTPKTEPQGSPTWGVETPEANTVEGGQAAVATGSTVNLRSGPGNTYPLITSLSQGTKVTLLAKSVGWSKVRTENGQVGWAPDWLISTNLNSNPLLPAQTQSQTSPKNKEIYGFYVQNNSQDLLSYRSLANYGQLLTGVVPFSYSITAQGKISGYPLTRAANLAQKYSLNNLALINNLSGTGFDSNLVHQVITNSGRRAQAIENIYNLLRRGGYTGVNIDFENMRPSDRGAFNTFIRELATKLRPHGYILSISVAAKTGDFPGSLWSGVYDYATLGRYADRIILMTYDQHSRVSGPGPVASIAWVDQVLRYATSQIPAEKLILGLAGYGYDWPSNGKNVRALTYAQAMARLENYNGKLKWDPEAKSPYFTYRLKGQTHTVWFENASSLASKIELANRYRLRGIALWRLGFEDPRFWQNVREKL